MKFDLARKYVLFIYFAPKKYSERVKIIYFKLKCKLIAQENWHKIYEIFLPLLTTFTLLK